MEKERASFSLGTPLKQGGMNKSPHEKIKKKFVEVTVLVACIGLAWMLLLIPIVFFQLPDRIYVDQEEDKTVESTMECSSAIPYPTQGGVCQSVLEDVLIRCGSKGSFSVLRNNEATANELISALRLVLNPTPECEMEAVPLLCLHLFGLCDSSGVSIQPTSGQCRNVRDNLCSREWEVADRFGFNLPDCKIFPEEQASCSGNGDNTSDISLVNNGTTSSLQNSSAQERLPCQENFFRPEGSATCVASCHTWSAPSQSVTISTDVAVALSTMIGFFTGLAVLAISLLRYKQMFSFPSIFVVYMNFDVVVISFFMIIIFFDRPFFYCSSENLVDSILHPTPFCVITGILFTYIILQLAFWWLFHTSALLWKIGFPLHARSFEKRGKIKYIHMACAIVGFAAPLIPVIALMAAFDREVNTSDELQAANITFATGGMGFVSSSFPPVLCFGRNGVVAYYSDILLINIIFFAGIAELIVLFHVVHKHHGLFTEKRSITSRFKIGTAERKVLITLCFYVLLLLIGIPTLTLATRTSSLLQEQVRKYFICEAGGVNPDNPGLCDESRDAYRKFTYAELKATSYILLTLFPTVFLLYSVNLAELKGKWMNLRQKKKGRSDSTSKSGTQSTKTNL